MYDHSTCKMWVRGESLNQSSTKEVFRFGWRDNYLTDASKSYSHRVYNVVVVLQ